MNEFVIKIDNHIQIVHKNNLKAAIVELLKTKKQEDIICYELGNQVLIRELF